MRITATMTTITTKMTKMAMTILAIAEEVAAVWVISGSRLHGNRVGDYQSLVPQPS